jgi:hypothetical protein
MIGRNKGSSRRSRGKKHALQAGARLLASTRLIRLSSISSASRRALARILRGCLLATGSRIISPPARVNEGAMRPPSVATSASAPARESAWVISRAACSLPPASIRGMTEVWLPRSFKGLSSGLECSRTQYCKPYPTRVRWNCASIMPATFPVSFTGSYDHCYGLRHPIHLDDSRCSFKWEMPMVKSDRNVGYLRCPPSELIS